MTLPGGGKRAWLLPILLSLLLHAPIALLLSRLPMIRTYSEPVLTLSLRSLPAVPKEVQTSPQAASPKQEPQLQHKPQPKRLPERLVTRRSSQETPAENRSDLAPQDEPSENAADQRITAPEQSVGVFAPPVPLPADPVDANSLRILKKAVPDYPAFSRKRGEEGGVRVIVLIKGGAVIEAEIYKSSGFPRLDQSALRAARSWRFDEAEEFRVIIPFNFSLTD